MTTEGQVIDMSYCSLCNWEAPILHGGTLYISYGKDSLACIGACEHLGWKINRIVHGEVWATETIPADLPPMVEFKKKADRIIKERWGIEVEHYCATNCDGVSKAKVTYEDVFYHTMTKGQFVGNIKGWPLVKGQWCQKLKLNSYPKCGGVELLGIAVDEPKRFGTLTDNKLSPIKEIGWEEDYCGLWCQYSDLLSPTYSDSYRGGCWFCHNQSVGQLRLLRHSYPEYWELMLKWDKDSPVVFNPAGHTVHDFDKRFQYEDEGVVPTDRTFRWDMLDRPLQISFFGGLFAEQSTQNL